MELSGNLSDFALADILQILALSRKSGTLSVETDGLEGRVLIESGRIVSIIIEGKGETKDIRSYLLETGAVNGCDLNRMVGVNSGLEREWTLKALLIESGLLSDRDYNRINRQYLREAIGQLLVVQKGRFGIVLNQHDLSRNHLEDSEPIGLEIGEVLLQAAIDKDERCRGREKSNESDKTYKPREKSKAGRFENQKGAKGKGSKDEDGTPCRERFNSISNRFNSLMEELKSYCFETEVSLMILRCASEIASRGILFVVQGDELVGAGQFGFSGGMNQRIADQIVRDTRIPLSSNGILAGVARIGEPYCGEFGKAVWDRELLKVTGSISGFNKEGKARIAFAVALVCGSRRRTRFVIYGENEPPGEIKSGQVPGFEEFLSLVNKAGFTLGQIRESSRSS